MKKQFSKWIRVCCFSTLVVCCATMYSGCCIDPRTLPQPLGENTATDNNVDESDFWGFSPKAKEIERNLGVGE